MKTVEEINMTEQRLIRPRRWPTYTALLVASACMCVSESICLLSPRTTIKVVLPLSVLNSVYVIV